MAVAEPGPRRLLVARRLVKLWPKSQGLQAFLMAPVNKRSLSERDICTKFITPALQKAGWDMQTQIREEFSFTKGRIIVRGKTHSRGKLPPALNLSP